MDKLGFYTGTEFFAQDWLGAHIQADGSVAFRCFAPAADGIELLLYRAFAHATHDAANKSDLVPAHYEMQRIWDGNFYEAVISDAHVGDSYVYRIWHQGSYQDHADPYALAAEVRPAWHSVIADLTYTWHDQAWMQKRDACYDKPLNIYELHLGSWKQPDAKGDSAAPRWYRYDELAEALIDHIKACGYTHVEFMPLCEYPFDGSWGYQPTGFFAPTSRYGSPQQLMELIDKLHGAGIGVICDCVPVHFATDAWGLANFDGTPLFEYPNDAVGVSEWGSHNFMYSRGETRSFMQSSCNFWLDAYHFDGIRMDAISRIIYWMGDEARGVNADAVRFVQTMNAELKARHPGIMLIAEDSTSYKGVTTPVGSDGLGFDYKWDMGWMHDTLEFFQTGPAWRPDNYFKLSFSMMYYNDERYLLPLSHDEVVHGKATIANKMWGDLEGKFPQARCLYLYMMAHPGKKLNFMGSEFAQLREWDENREQDWMLLQYPNHDAFLSYIRELNALYASHPALWQRDYVIDDTEASGFTWRKIDDPKNVVYAFERRGTTSAGQEERLLAIFNLADREFPVYDIAVPSVGTSSSEKLQVLINTAWERFGGSVVPGTERSIVVSGAGTPASKVSVSLKPFSAMLVQL